MLKPFLFGKNVNADIQDYLNFITKVVTIRNIYTIYYIVLLIAKINKTIHNYSCVCITAKMFLSI